MPPQRFLHKPTIVILLLLSLLSGRGLFAADQSSVRFVPADPQSTLDPLRAADLPFVPGEVLVGLHGDQFQQHRRLQGTERATAESLLAAIEPREMSLLTAPVLGEPVEVRLEVAEGEEWSIIDRLRQDPAVLFAEPNWIVQASTVADVQPLAPNDSFYRDYQWNVQRIRSSRAWAIGQGGYIHVAVLDSGIDLNHPEFKDRVLPGKNYISTGQPPQDDSGHGTHVSGIIGASLNNVLGIAGLAPNARLDPRKVLDGNNRGSVGIVSQAIREAADDGARIINLSLEVGAPSTVLESAINYAAAKGVLLVASVGNWAPTPVRWPAAYPAVLAVAATDRYDVHTYYSSPGPEVDIAAPGGLGNQLIYSTWPAEVLCGTPLPGGYCTAIGTSTAAAHVSGVAALVWGSHPDLSANDVRAILLETARKTGEPADRVGAGRVDAEAAMRRGLQSDLRLSTSSIHLLAETESGPITQMVILSNPSSAGLSWQASVSNIGNWLSLSQTTGGQLTNGVIQYGSPAQITLTIAPQGLTPGRYSETVTVEATRSTGAKVIERINVELQVVDRLHRHYLPLTMNLDRTAQWRRPGAQDRQRYQMSNDSSIGLAIPFVFPLGSEKFTDLRFYDDGFVTLPAQGSVIGRQTTCLGGESPARPAIYGWWDDLDPGRGGELSTFQTADGAFVIEFMNVSSAATVSPQYTTSFQIVMHASGRIELIYGDVPANANGVTVGVEALDGLFFQQIACHTGSGRFGQLPSSGSSYVIDPEDLR
jgi:subtilisin family serine protease